MLFSSVVPSYAHAKVVEKYEMKKVDIDEQVNTIIDQFHYKMTVEWDQLDLDFKKQVEEDLKHDLLDLKANGISLVDFQKALEKKIMGGKAKADYENFMNAMKSQNLSDEEIQAKAMEFIKKNYSEGLDFVGGGSTTYYRWTLVATIIAIGVITYTLVKKIEEYELPTFEIPTIPTGPTIPDNQEIPCGYITPCPV